MSATKRDARNPDVQLYHDYPCEHAVLCRMARPMP